MELSDILTPAELKALDESNAKVEAAKDTVTRAYLRNTAEESAESRAAVDLANENLNSAIAADDAFRKPFDARLEALARKNLGLPPK